LPEAFEEWGNLSWKQQPGSTVTVGSYVRLAFIRRKLKSESGSVDGFNMSTSAISIQGLEQANDQLNAAADAIAKAVTPPSSSVPVAPDLAADIVSLTSAQTQFETSISTLKTADQIEQRLIDITA
jgi:hypothetical protein